MGYDIDAQFSEGVQCSVLRCFMVGFKRVFMDVELDS